MSTQSSFKNGKDAAAQKSDSAVAGDWRYQAMLESIRVGALDGNAVESLMHSIRARFPGAAIMRMWMTFSEIVELCRANCGEVRSLLPGHDYHNDSEETFTYAGWYSMRWQDEELEIVLSPNSGDTGTILLFGGSDETVRAFTEKIVDDTQNIHKRCLIYTAGWHGSPELDEEISKVSWDDIVLPPQLLHDVRVSVESFFANREVYAEFGFAWHRGMLLIGPPGTGKTMLAKAAAAATPHVPFLYVRDLMQSYDCQEAITAIFKRARHMAPCILAFDDLDGFLHEGNRTLFLNELDGFKNNDGLFVIASSNHPDKIDEALLRRPSRFDRVFHIGLPAHPERREYSHRLLTRTQLGDRLAAGFDVEKLAEAVAEKTDGFTPAYLKEAFISAALLRAHEGARVLDEEFEKSLFVQIEELKKHLRRSKNPLAMTEMSTGDSIGLRHN